MVAGVTTGVPASGRADRHFFVSDLVRKGSAGSCCLEYALLQDVAISQSKLLKSSLPNASEDGSLTPSLVSHMHSAASCVRLPSWWDAAKVNSFDLDQMEHHSIQTH